ncbi:hypothetical protein BDR03DRAFT_501334 [Suillus americanus]|nr:hypothetical protein BDR03DRAFT_501334 [Suillus americanus]
MVISPFYGSFLKATLLWRPLLHFTALLVFKIINGSRYQIDKKNFWRYDGFIATSEIGDIRVNIFTFGANTASAEDGIYRNTIRRNYIRGIGRFLAGRFYCQRSRRHSNFDSISEILIIDAMARHA